MRKIIGLKKAPTAARTGKELEDLGAAYAKNLRGGDIVVLKGELGAGKTTFARGIARTLGIRKRITSPTFTIMNVYKLPPQARKKFRATQLVHADTYRLENPDEIFTLGLDEFVHDPETITLIEWGDKIAFQLRRHYPKVVSIKQSPDGRAIRL